MASSVTYGGLSIRMVKSLMYFFRPKEMVLRLSGSSSDYFEAMEVSREKT
jgi:hypothetical protein